MGAWNCGLPMKGQGQWSREEEAGQEMDWETTGLSCAYHTEGKGIMASEVSRGVKGKRGTAVTVACLNSPGAGRHSDCTSRW